MSERWGRLARRTRRGAAFAHGGAPAHKLVERVAPSAPTTLLRVRQTKQHVVIYTSERANAVIAWTERHNSA